LPFVIGRNPLYLGWQRTVQNGTEPHLDPDHDARLANRQPGCPADAVGGGIVIDTKKLRGRAALDALEADGRLWAYPAEVAVVMERDVKTLYPALEKGEIPAIRVGQRWQISIAWLRRSAEGVTA
jgi:hypothetical protein